MPLRFGLVTGEYPPMQGGVGAYTQELARAMSRNGYQIHIITDRRARPSVEQRNWQLLREPVDLGFAQLHAQVSRWRWPVLSTLADIAIRNELDLVNIQYQAAAFDMSSPAVNFLPWRLKGITKTAVTFHDLRLPYLFPKAGKLRGAAVEFMARQAHGVVVTNSVDFQKMTDGRARALAQIPIGSNISVTPIGASRLVEMRATLGIGPDHFLLGYFGFLNESKGADLLLRALARQSENTHLIFIGGQTGSSDLNNNQLFLSRMRQLVSDLDLSERVHWTGFVSDEAVSGYLAAADLMVLPYRDGVSLRRGTLMAILAHGRPLLTTQPVVPLPELVHGQHVYLIPPGEVASLSDAIAKLKADPSLRSRLGHQAKLRASSFSWDMIAKRTAEFFTTLVRE